MDYPKLLSISLDILHQGKIHFVCLLNSGFKFYLLTCLPASITLSEKFSILDSERHVFSQASANQFLQATGLLLVNANLRAFIEYVCQNYSILISKIRRLLKVKAIGVLANQKNL